MRVLAAFVQECAADHDYFHKSCIICIILVLLLSQIIIACIIATKFKKRLNKNIENRFHTTTGFIITEHVGALVKSHNSLYIGKTPCRDNDRRFLFTLRRKADRLLQSN